MQLNARIEARTQLSATAAAPPRLRQPPAHYGAAKSMRWMNTILPLSFFTTL